MKIDIGGVWVIPAGTRGSPTLIKPQQDNVVMWRGCRLTVLPSEVVAIYVDAQPPRWAVYREGHRCIEIPINDNEPIDTSIAQVMLAAGA